MFWLFIPGQTKQLLLQLLFIQTARMPTYPMMAQLTLIAAPSMEIGDPQLACQARVLITGSNLHGFHFLHLIIQLQQRNLPPLPGGLICPALKLSLLQPTTMPTQHMNLFGLLTKPKLPLIVLALKLLAIRISLPSARHGTHRFNG